MTPAEEGRRRGLGRGLSVLFGDEEAAPAPATLGRPTKAVPIELLRPNPRQPRKRFDDAAIDGLVESIREKGVLQPILVRPHPEQGNAYEIVAGERRWRAAQRAKLYEVPVVVKELSERDTLEIALIENIHREDLTPLEEADAYQRLIDDFSHSQEGLATAIGKSRSHIANMLRLRSLPEEVKALVDEGQLSAGHARALIGLDNAVELARMVVKKGLNVRQTERLAQQAKSHSAETNMRRIHRAVDSRDPDTVALEESVSASLGLKVSIRHTGEKGALTVHFDTFDQLDDVLARLTGGQ